jgi:serpin B
MVHMGAGGVTLDELRKALGVPYEGERDVPRYWGGLLLATRDRGSGDLAAFGLAGSMWVDRKFLLGQEYLEYQSLAFGNSYFRVDFGGEPSGVMAAMNGWARDVTGGRAGTLTSSPLPRETELALASAACLKGIWKDAFPAADTSEGDFRADGGRAVKAMFMRRSGVYRYLEDGAGQAVEIPYLWGRFVMTVLLPSDAEGTGGLEALVRDADPESLARRLGGLAYANVELTLPRFAFAWGTESLKGALAAMGVRAAFSEGADLSGVSPYMPGLGVSEVLHLSAVAVDEEGAVTPPPGPGVITRPLPGPPARFAADRPFVFFVRDNATGGVIFMGRLSDPSAS